MKNVMILFFVLLTNVAGFAVEEVCNNGFGVVGVCVEAATGGDIDMVQTLHRIEVVVTENDGNWGDVTVLDSYGEVVFFKSFDNNALVIVDTRFLNNGDYFLVAKAGTTNQVLGFMVE